MVEVQGSGGFEVKEREKEMVRLGAGTLARGMLSAAAMKRGLAGAKPDAVCRWCFEVMGAEPDDELTDMFPGSGAVTLAWESWRAQASLLTVAADVSAASCLPELREPSDG